MRWHWVTRLLVLSVLARQAADVVQIAGVLHRWFGDPNIAGGSLQTLEHVWPFVLRTVSYTVAGFGGAAAVEFLYRAWRGLRVQRLALEGVA